MTSMGILLDPLGLMLVIGGAVLLGIVQSGRSAAYAAFRVIARRPIAADDDEAVAAERLVHAARAAVGHRGLFAAETLEPRHHFLRTALAELADAHDPDQFRIAMSDLEARERVRDSASATFWAEVADAAPALGMIGTVLGMIGMAADMGDPARVGPALAVALTSTLYGLIVSACIATPAAQRCELRAVAATRWRARFSSALSDLLTRELRGSGAPVR